MSAEKTLTWLLSEVDPTRKIIFFVVDSQFKKGRIAKRDRSQLDHENWAELIKFINKCVRKEDWTPEVIAGWRRRCGTDAVHSASYEEYVPSRFTYVDLICPFSPESTPRSNSG